MKFNWKKIFPTWKRDEEVRTQNEQLLILVNELTIQAAGLTYSLGVLGNQIEGLRAEAVNLLSAITAQHGGEFIIKSEFFEVLADPNNKNLELKVEREKDGSVELKLAPRPEENNE